MSAQFKERIHAVWWEGPFSPRKIRKFQKQGKKRLKSWTLYSVYGSHPLYGNNVLLYIGMVDDLSTQTERNVASRLAEHDYWFDSGYFGESKIFVGAIDPNEFSGWKSFDESGRFYGAERHLIEDVEALLIYAHQPAYNRKNRNSAKRAKDLRIFNVGAKRLLNDEVSGFHHIGNPEHFVGDEGER